MSKPDTQTEELLTLSLEQYRKLLQHAENLLKNAQVEPLLKESEELTSIFITSRKTARND